MEILITLIITVLVALYISLPFFMKKDRYVNCDFPDDSASNTPHIEKLKRLDNYKESLLAALKDIEFDYGLGKLSKEDYEELSLRYKNEAASVLERMDSLKPAIEDKKIEEEIFSYRKSKEASIASDTELEDEILAYRKSYNMNTSDNCPQCGAKYAQNDLYCSKCGEKLN